jgi:hypothetical protein
MAATIAVPKRTAVNAAVANTPHQPRNQIG